jgi:small subunit ribosomal protein S17
VVSDKMQKTVLVAVEEHITHPLYKKRVRRMRRFMAHDERGDAHLGDRVRILEAAPISKRKRWQLVEVLERVELPEVAAESIDLELLGEVKHEDDSTEIEPVAKEAVAAKPASVEEAEPPAETEEIAVEEVAEPEPEPEAATEQSDVSAEEPAPEEFDETPEASPEEIAAALGEEEAERESAPDGQEKPE